MRQDKVEDWGKDGNEEGRVVGGWIMRKRKVNEKTEEGLKIKGKEKQKGNSKYLRNPDDS